MKLKKILDWFDGVLKVGDFDDVSNNGLQIAREGDDVRLVAFAVDGSLKSVKAAVAAGAQLLVVHHGISWGGATTMAVAMARRAAGDMAAAITRVRRRLGRRHGEDKI